MNVSDALNKAADLIEERGWWSKSQGGTGIEPWCAGEVLRATALIEAARERETVEVVS